jgi:hypothetical protein
LTTFTLVLKAVLRAIHLLSKARAKAVGFALNPLPTGRMAA